MKQSDDENPEILRVFQTKEETRNFYDKIASVYDLLAEKTEQPLRQVGLELLAAKSGESILEIGFATGTCLPGLIESVGEAGQVNGIDLSPNMKAQATRRLSNIGLDHAAELTTGDAAQLPYADETFDAIFCSFTLELFDTPDLTKVLQEWHRVLKHRGRIVIVSITLEGESNWTLKAFEWTHRHFPNLMDCRPIYARRAIEAAGYRIQAARVEKMWVPVEIVLGHKN